MNSEHILFTVSQRRPFLLQAHLSFAFSLFPLLDLREFQKLFVERAGIIRPNPFETSCILFLFYHPPCLSVPLSL
jgi:hypothetical protein